MPLQVGESRGTPPVRSPRRTETVWRDGAAGWGRLEPPEAGEGRKGSPQRPHRDHAPDTCSQTSGLQPESVFLLSRAPWWEGRGHGSPRTPVQTPMFTCSVSTTRTQLSVGRPGVHRVVTKEGRRRGRPCCLCHWPLVDGRGGRVPAAGSRPVAGGGLLQLLVLRIGWNVGPDTPSPWCRCSTDP